LSAHVIVDLSWHRGGFVAGSSFFDDHLFTSRGDASGACIASGCGMGVSCLPVDYDWD
tara:strand:+ start:388 stop:561 length:174 start_codon:yes stop_codon:yes gene_type:complete